MQGKTPVWLALLCSCRLACAAELPPRYLTEPVLGLQYDRKLAKFAPLPAALRSSCASLADNRNMRSHWYVYAKAQQADGGTYYIAGGYSVRSHPSPPDYPRYELDAKGVVFGLQSGACTVFDDARTAFGAAPMAAIPSAVLQSLARDHARRLSLALGGPLRMRQALRVQAIDIERLPAELRQAYRPLLNNH